MVTVVVPPSDCRYAITQRISGSVRPIGGLLIVGIPGLNPGTMKALGSYIACAKYSTSLRPGSRVFARTATLARSGKRYGPSVFPIVWHVRQKPFPSMIWRPTFAISGVVRSVLSTTSAGGCTSFCGTIWPTYM